MDKEKPKAVDPKRRGFLRAAGGAGALGALAVAAGQAPAQPVAVVPAPAEPAKAAGYHETEHIRQYYRSARYW
jgi:hypothetical protein